MKTLKFIFFVFITISSGNLIAGELPSRAFLGVSGSNPGADPSGALVDTVLPGGTGEAMELQAGDLITAINSSSVESFGQLVNALSQMVAGDSVTLLVLRDSEKLELTGKVKPRPKEQAPENSSFDIIYDSVNYKSNQLRSIVYRPHTATVKQPHAAIYFVQGYTCGSIDFGLLPEASSHQLLMSLADAGYVVYKIEKFSVGDSVGELQCSQVDFSTELQGFVAGLQALKSYDFVDPDQVHLFGHSLGGVYAPLIAQKSDVKSLISYGSVVRSWYYYLLDIYSEQSKIFGTSAAVGLANRKTVQPLIKAWLKSELSWQEIVSSEDLQEALSSNLVPVSGEQVFHRHYSFFRDLNQYDLAKAWKETGSHVLAIHGSLDIQAINDEWATQMTSLPENKELKTKKVVLEGAEHGFLRYKSMSEYLIARNTGAYNPGRPGNNYDPRVAQTIIDWIRSLT